LIKSVHFALVDTRQSMFRKPKRINVTVPELLLEQLQEIADYEGRSLSSLCCHLLEVGAQERQNKNAPK